MIPVLILLIFIFSVVLIKSADYVVVAIRRLSRSTKTGVFAMSAIILAIGTSFPELFVGITSALEKTPSLSFGVVIGSNIANISLVAGLTALIAGKVHVQESYLKRDVGIALGAGLLPIALVLDGALSRLDGLILLVVYGAYSTSFFRGRFLEIAEEHKKESFVYRFLRRFSHIDTTRTKELGRLFAGVALLLFSADMIVRISTILGSLANIPIFVIGLIVLAAGTSLPEFAFSLRSIEDHHPSMFFGNLLGSTIANSTLVIGVASIIHPIVISNMSNYFVAAVTFIVVYAAFWQFIRSKHRLDRREAVVLLLLYAIFLVVEFI